MNSVEVKSKVKTLRSNLNSEMVNDLQSSYGFDPDELVLKILKDFRRENRKKSIKNIFTN